jgi:hypothetical protein
MENKFGSLNQFHQLYPIQFDFDVSIHKLFFPPVYDIFIGLRLKPNLFLRTMTMKNFKLKKKILQVIKNFFNFTNTKLFENNKKLNSKPF